MGCCVELEVGVVCEYEIKVGVKDDVIRRLEILRKSRSRCQAKSPGDNVSFEKFHLGSTLLFNSELAKKPL